ncbi:MAG: glycosyltransferase family 39 protein [Bacteroidetes bacterium]|nr:glycosyltransferase family 39 protein [Bacteroidota bacterium]
MKFVFSKKIQFPLWEFLLLMGFILLNLFLKSYCISDESIYGDEANSIFYAQQPLSKLIAYFQYDQNPPAYFILLHFWINLTGVSDISIKFLSILFSTGCGVLIYFFAKKHFNFKTALFAIFLFTFSNSQLFFSRECRSYAFIQFLTVTSFFIFMELLKKPTYLKAFLLTVTNLLLLYSHYITVFIPLTQAIFSLTLMKQNTRGFLFTLKSHVGLALLFIPWLKIVLMNVPKSGLYWLKPPDFNTMKIMSAKLFGEEILRNVFVILLITAIVLFLLNLKWNKIFSEHHNQKFLLLSAWVIIPFFGDYFLAQITPVFLDRYILYTTIGLFLLTGYFISILNIDSKLQYLIFFTLLSFVVFYYHPVPEKDDDWKNIVPRVSKLRNERTAIVVSASYKLKEFSFYFDQACFRDYDHFPEVLAKFHVYGFDNNVVDWNLMDTSRTDHIILVQSHHWVTDPRDTIGFQIRQKGFVLQWDYLNKENFLNGVKVDYYSKAGINPLSFVSTDTILSDPAKCDGWELERGFSSGNEKREILHYLNQFDFTRSCDSYQNLTDKRSYSGKQSTYVSRDHQYSFTFSKRLDELNFPGYLMGSAMIYHKDSISKARMVVSVEKNHTILSYRNFSMSGPDEKSNHWEKLNFSQVLENFPHDAEVKVYLFDAEGDSTYMDNMNLYFTKNIF